MTDTVLLSLTNRNVPRYTSYPTAPHFNAEVDGSVYGDWLEQIGDSSGVSLYFHIPFCRQMCAYCGCTTKATLKDEPIIEYVGLLRREMRLVAARAGRLHVNHIHWGGGTPNLVPAALFQEMVDEIHRLFHVDSEAEHAIELDPRHLTRDGANALKAAGINRASLGVQDFDPVVQQAIGRIQPLEMVEQSMNALYAAGITAINFDLIYGLPFQTEASARRTAMLAAGMAPSRLALFGYAHVPWFKGHQRLIREEDLPGTEQRHRLAAISRQTIDAFGYDPVGIDHFARPEDELAIGARTGKLHRNFQGYTTDHAATLIGLGASSIGRTRFGYAQNPPDMGHWARAISEDRLATARGKILSPDDLFRAEIIEQILCTFSVDLQAVCERHSMLPSVLHGARVALEPMVAAGFVDFTRTHLRIVEHGAQLARVIAAAFDSYLESGGRHSAAV